MYKNVSRGLEISNLNANSIMDYIAQGNNIIFILNEGKLLGAITEGDINRCLKNGWKAADESMINYHISYIVKLSENSVYVEAEKIFSKHLKIHNIPVVNQNGIFLYQIDRKKKSVENVREHLTKIRKYKPLPIFMECYEARHIALIGERPEVLDFVKDFLEAEMRENLNNKADIYIIRKIAECKKLPENTIIISLSNTIIRYLRSNGVNNIRIESIEEIANYYFYTKLNQINDEAIENFKNLFGYEAIYIHGRNKYIDYFLKKMKLHGMHIIQTKGEETGEFLGTDICFYSIGEMQERVTIECLSTTLQRIQEYCYIAKIPLSREKYIKEYIACLGKLKEDGLVGVVLYPSYNLLYRRVYEIVKEFRWIKIRFEGKTAILWLDGEIPSQKVAEEQLRDIRYLCFDMPLVNICYDLVCSYCKHVYVHRMTLNMQEYKKYIKPNRVIENYEKNSEYFSDNFAKELYGDNGFSIKHLLLDLQGCEAVFLNDGYVKYQSNYVSDFFNTDTYGCRITTEAPENYVGTIYLVGTCIYAGYAVGDGDTVASILQKKLNSLGKSYRVVNFSLGGSNFWNQIDRISEVTMNSHDIVIYWVNEFWNREDDKYVIKLDMDNLVTKLTDNEYWDTPIHCGRKGYEILTEQIYNKIELDLVQPPFTRKFYLGIELEKKVSEFVGRIMKQVIQNQVYTSNAGRSAKSGAIVMNCNPFTYGHQYLIETASRLVDVLYIFVVEEDKSIFTFNDRLRMVKKGVEGFSNIIVLSSGEFMISSVTFPGYFMKENPDAACYDSFLDLMIFAHYIVPALNISKRFVGEEPFDKVTAKYNFDMKLILGRKGVDVIEIPRKKLGSEIISATRVRSLIKTKRYEELQQYVPDSTFHVIEENYL